MRDIFEEIFENQPLDPNESARRNMRPNLRTRFYQHATVGEAEWGFGVLLDGRPVRTPAGNPLAAPLRALAEALAAEGIEYIGDWVLDDPRRHQPFQTETFAGLKPGVAAEWSPRPSGRGA